MISRSGVIVLVGLLILIGISYGPRFYALLFYERTTGTITGTVVKKAGNRPHNISRKSFSVTSYTVNGNTYEIEGPGMHWHDQYMGKPMQVLYNGSQPNKAYLGELIILFGEPVWWVVFVAFFWWIIVTKTGVTTTSQNLKK
jgi:hypothetical protein